MSQTDIPNTGSGDALSPNNVMQRLMKGDIAVALGIVTILTVLLLPMPSWLLDFSLSISITFSVIILMVVIFMERPLDFNSYPTVLLIATMIRLALNIASTRLILSHGHEGTDAAGSIIEAFGSFVMSGNFLIGIIIFGILVIVNLIVITKGAGRIAEVAARFTLDAMPGKQMAIDADLSSGILTEEEAKQKRKDLQDESAFYGAMDGASKFVRGDAVAGLLITAINIIGGMIIGIAQNDMAFIDAANSYTLLTVGDGLVSQIPAIIVSLSAGLLVSKAGVEGSTDQVMLGQLGGYPEALAMTSFLMLAMGFLPGLPILPFLAMSSGVGYLSYKAFRKKQQDESVKAAEKVAGAAVAGAAKGGSGVPAVADGSGQPTSPLDEPISTALAMDDLRLELGYALLPLINDAGGYALTDQIKALRRQIASEMGFVMPSVRILDNMQLPQQNYMIRVKEVEAGEGTLKVGHLLVMDPRGEPVSLDGEQTVEPTFGLPATWISETLRDEASFRGYTVVDPATVITTHLTEIVRENMSEMLSYAEVQKLLEDISAQHKKLLDDIVPSQITVSGIQRVLQTLLSERVSIRDLTTILEGIAEASGFTQNIVSIAEHVRTRIGRQICNANMSPNGYLPMITMTPEWETAFAESIVGQGDERQLAMAPSQLQDFIHQVRDTFEQVALQGEVPVLLTSPAIRPYVRSIIERFRPATTVMSQNEIHPSIRIRTLGQI